MNYYVTKYWDQGLKIKVIVWKGGKLVNIFRISDPVKEFSLYLYMI